MKLTILTFLLFSLSQAVFAAPDFVCGSLDGSGNTQINIHFETDDLTKGTITYYMKDVMDEHGSDVISFTSVRSTKPGLLFSFKARFGKKYPLAELVEDDEFGMVLKVLDQRYLGSSSLVCDTGVEYD